MFSKEGDFLIEILKCLQLMRCFLIEDKIEMAMKINKEILSEHLADYFKKHNFANFSIDEELNSYTNLFDVYGNYMLYKKKRGENSFLEEKLKEFKRVNFF